MPEEAPVNNMAPVAPKAKGRAPAKVRPTPSYLHLVISINWPQPKPTRPLHQEDPPLRLEAPKPVQQRAALQDLAKFGFKAAPEAPRQAQREPIQVRKPVQTYTTQKKNINRDPSLPPSKARISDRFPAPANVSRHATIPESEALEQEMVPDSEEERHRRNNDNETDQGSDEEESEEEERGAGDGEDDTEEGLSQDLGMPLELYHEIDEAALAEIGLDPFANENAEPGEFFTRDHFNWI